MGAIGVEPIYPFPDGLYASQVGVRNELLDQNLNRKQLQGE